MVIILNLSDKIKLLEAEVLEKEADLTALNNRVNKLTEELEKAGCIIVNAMGIDFEINNDLANKLENKLRRIAANLRAHDRFEAYREIFEEE